MTRYDLLYLASLPALAPYLAWRRLVKGKYTESAEGMMGRRLPAGEQAAAFADGSLWVHAVSVGEVNAARAVVPQLAQLRPDLPLVVSTITQTGQATARAAFPQAHVTYFPADFSPIVGRFQRVFRPRVFVLMETELWPNFLMMAARAGCQCFMINAKLSDRSFPRYRRFQGALRPALDALAGVCTQTERDAQRFAHLGIDPARIQVAGNCKFDIKQHPLTEQERADLYRELGMNPARTWIVAGSTHPGEEELMLQAVGQLRQRHPGVGLLLCPRHPERFEQVAAAAAAAGWSVGRASAPGAMVDPQVVVLDRMGVLARAYGLGRVAIVAGSFCPVGGHNLLEAAAHGVPFVYGPDMHSQGEIYRLCREADAGLQVEAGELAATLGSLLEDAALWQTQGQRSEELIRRNQGSSAKAVQAVADWLKK